jgi:hypothetical protein
MGNLRKQVFSFFALLVVFISGKADAITFQPFKLHLNIFSQNIWVHRGALIWDIPFLATDIVMQFGDNLYINTNSAIYHRKFSENQHSSFGIKLFDDKRPLYPTQAFGNVSLNYKNSRPVTYEAFFAYEYKYQNILSLNPEVYLDLREHQGIYIGVDVATNAIKNTTLGFHYSYGTEAMNQYLYGVGASDGFADSSAFIMIDMPVLPISANMKISYFRTQIIQAENIEAYYIQGKRNNDIFKVEIFWSF